MAQVDLPNRSKGGVRIAQEFGVTPPPSPRVNLGVLPTSTPATTNAINSPPITRQAPQPFSPTPNTSPTGLGGVGGGAPMAGGSSFGGSSSFQSGPGVAGDPNSVVGVNPEFENTILARMRGEGIGPSYEQIVNDVYNPQAALIDQAFGRTREDTFSDLAGRGVLDSSTTSKEITRLAETQGLQKAALLGQLGLDYNNQQQRAIGEAIGQYGILEGNRIQAKTTITAANINASAQVRSASINAGASVAAAKIGAQARLQEAGMNAEVALARLRQEREQNAFDAGVDLSDPQSVQDWYDYNRDSRDQEIELIDYELNRKQRESRGYTDEAPVR